MIIVLHQNAFQHFLEKPIFVSVQLIHKKNYSLCINLVLLQAIRSCQLQMKSTKVLVAVRPGI